VLNLNNFFTGQFTVNGGLMGGVAAAVNGGHATLAGTVANLRPAALSGGTLSPSGNGVIGTLTIGTRSH